MAATTSCTAQSVDSVLVADPSEGSVGAFEVAGSDWRSKSEVLIIDPVSETCSASWTIPKLKN